MMYLEAKYLTMKELPEKPPYPKSYLITLLANHESISLIGKQEVFEALSSVEEFEDVLFEVTPRQLDLSQFGASGKAFRLVLSRVIEQEAVK